MIDVTESSVILSYPLPWEILNANLSANSWFETHYRTQDAVTVPLFNIHTQFFGYFKIFGESEAVFHDIKRFWGIWNNQMVKIFKILVFVALGGKQLEKNEF